MKERKKKDRCENCNAVMRSAMVTEKNDDGKMRFVRIGSFCKRCGSFRRRDNVILVEERTEMPAPEEFRGD